LVKLALVKIGLDGLRYLQTYDWLFLRALITVGYLGWIAFALTIVIDLHVLHGKIETSRPLGGTLFFSSVIISLYSSFVVSKSPLTYYAYAIFPVAFWEEVYARRHLLVEGRNALFGEITYADGLIIILKAALFVGLIECLVRDHKFTILSLLIPSRHWATFTGSSSLSYSRSLRFGQHFMDRDSFENTNRSRRHGS
jgi:phosphatidylinositol glycan class N